MTLPFALPGIVAGTVLRFRQSARRIRRHYHVRLRHSRRNADVSAAIYTLLQIPGGEALAIRLVLIAIALSLGALIVSEWFARRAGVRLRASDCPRRRRPRRGRAPNPSRIPTSTPGMTGTSRLAKPSYKDL